MARFSFIIPAFNEEKYIGPCLDAIFALDGLGDSEVIVVDNASTDATAGIVREKYPRVTLVSESRKGTGWARQAGLEAAHGDYVCYIDADNAVPAGWLANVKKKMERSPGCVACTGPYYYREFGAVRNVFVKWTYALIFLPFCVVLDVMNRGGILFGGNMVIQRTALQKIGGIDTSLTYWGDDTFLARQLRGIGRIKFFMDMNVMSSARRYAKAGFFRTTVLYCLNGFSVIVTGKPMSHHYEAFR